MSQFTIRSIGNVHVDSNGFWLSVDKPYRKGLKELNQFSHINVLWWADQSQEFNLDQDLLLNKPYKKGPDSIGLFATRSETRPNSILLSAVSVIQIHESDGVIEIPWVDALDGTPILDIKPYQPCSDRIQSVSQPEWCQEWPEWYEDSAEFDWEGVFNF